MSGPVPGAAGTAAPLIRSARLDLRLFDAQDVDDAAFIVELLNDPGWLRHIGDRQVRTLEDARAYIDSGPLALYRRHGFSLYLVQRRADGARLGMCGLVKRDGLDDPDIGFAFLPAARGRGYALEAAHAVMDHARDVLRLPRVVAIVSPGNEASIRLLRRLGLASCGELRLAEGAPTLLFSPA